MSRGRLRTVTAAIATDLQTGHTLPAYNPGVSPLVLAAGRASWATGL